jgi:hypothetical protein
MIAAAIDPSASPAQLRQLSSAELAALGERSLREHLLAQARTAHQEHGPLTPATLVAFLADRKYVRYPTRLAFEFGDMAAHQFAQPGLDPSNPPDGRILYLRPALRARPDWIALAVAYMTPLLNYGDIITDEHCLLFGATLQGLMTDEFYRQICAMADLAGAEQRFP